MSIEEIATNVATQRVGGDYAGKAPITEDARDWQMIFSACVTCATKQREIDITKLKCALNAVMIDTHDKERIIAIMLED